MYNVRELHKKKITCRFLVPALWDLQINHLLIDNCSSFSHTNSSWLRISKAVSKLGNNCRRFYYLILHWNYTIFVTVVRITLRRHKSADWGEQKKSKEIACRLFSTSPFWFLLLRSVGRPVQFQMQSRTTKSSAIVSQSGRAFIPRINYFSAW